jgi:hypothetical protein
VCLPSAETPRGQDRIGPQKSGVFCGLFAPPKYTPA